MKSIYGWMLAFALVSVYSFSSSVVRAQDNLPTDEFNDASLENIDGASDSVESGKKVSKNEKDSGSEVGADELDNALDPQAKTESAPNNKGGQKAEPAPSQPIDEPTGGGGFANDSSGTSDGAKVTGLDFNSSLNGGTVIIKTNKPVSFMTRKSEEKKQFIIELAGTELPAKFKRPYDTKEFSGPIGLINAYQKKGSKTARIVLQLQAAAEFTVTPKGNSLLVSSSGGSEPTDSKEAQNSNTEGNDETAQVNDGSENQAADNGSAESGGDIQTRRSTAPQAKFMTSGTESPAGPASGGEGRYYGHPINLQVKDADVREVLSFIAEESGMNLVISDEVKGTISLKLKRIPWDQALLVILQAKQLGYAKQGRILRIAPLGKLKEEAQATRDAIDSQKAVANLRTRIMKINYAEASKLDKAVAQFLTPSRGKSVVDERTNQLIVTDLDEVLDKVAELIRRLDRPTQQVLIEGKIVEVTENASQALGINYVSTANNLSFGYLPTPAAGHQIGITFEGSDLNVTIGMLESENKVKVLSSPRIVTLNNVAARISQSQDYPTYSAILATPTTPAATQVNFQKVQQVDLKVLPQISNDNTVTMQVDLKREFVGSVDASAGGTSTSARPKYSREASARLLVRDGQTAVLGGIFLNELTNSQTMFPFLGRIPLIGLLFKGTTVDEIKNELVIFLTPKIMDIEANSQTRVGPKSRF